MKTLQNIYRLLTTNLLDVILSKIGTETYRTNQTI